MGAEPSAAARVRALRGAKEAVDPWRPIEVLVERERTGDGGSVPCVTVFLAGAECPFTCRFCDLWRRTLDGPTPAGALPAQLSLALAEARRRGLAEPAAATLKLYNASNFFEPRAVPAADRQRLAELAAPFARVVVECHPRLVDREAQAFAAALAAGGGARLEVAMGLETAHPAVLPRLDKGMTLDDFDRAAALVAERGIDLRVFVLVGLPWLAPREAVDWAVVSAAYALDRGARVVTLIPLRGGNGELDRLAAEGSFREPRLAEIESALRRALALPARRGDAVVLVDTWDLERFAGCPACRDERLARLVQMNADGRGRPPVDCAACDEPGRRRRGR